MPGKYKTLYSGMSKTRKGKPPIGLQTMIDRSMSKRSSSAFFGELRKLAANSELVSVDDAVDAAKYLSRSKKDRAIDHVTAGGIPALLGPGVSAAGRATTALIDAKRGRFGAMRKAIKNTTKGQAASDMIRGGMVGAGISYGREGMQTARARNTYDRFMAQYAPRRKRKA